MTGATGSVGSFAVQLASLAGALVTAVASQAEQDGDVRKLCAHTCLASTTFTGRQGVLIVSHHT